MQNLQFIVQLMQPRMQQGTRHRWPGEDPDGHRALRGGRIARLRRGRYRPTASLRDDASIRHPERRETRKRATLWQQTTLLFVGC